MVRSLADGENYPADFSEDVIQNLLHHGNDWDYVDCDREALLNAYKSLEQDLISRFSAAVSDFEAENTTAYQIKVQRVQSFFERRIAQDEQRLRTLREAERDPRVIRATEGRLQTALRNREQRLADLESKAHIDIERGPVAAGVFRVTGRLHKEV
jgi:hypothetical protein